MKKKILGLAAALLLGLAACQTGNLSLSQDAKQTNSQLQQYQAAQPVPYYDFSEQRHTLIQIYNAKNEARQTWAVLQSMTGVAIYACESIGFPIPADTQLTSPDQIAVVNPAGLNNNTTLYDGVVSQMEPDGLYTSGNTDATYVLCIHNGKPTPLYTEQKVTMFPFPVEVVDGKIVDVAGGANTIEVEVKGSVGVTPSPASSTQP